MSDARDVDREMLHLVVEALRAMLWRVDRSFTILSRSGRAFAEHDALPGTPLAAFVAAGDARGLILASHERALAGETVSYELDYRGRLYRAIVHPERGADGGIVGVAGFATDVSRTRETSRSLRRSQAALALAQSAARLGSWTYDMRTGEVTVSDELRALAGIGGDAALPWRRTLCARLARPDRRTLLAAVAAASRTRESFTLDTRVRRDDGEVLWVQHRGRFLYDGETALSAVGTVMDITSRALADERFKRSANVDELTGLPNRRSLVERLGAALDAAAAAGEQLAVLSVDLDRFRTINETLGHGVGDQFLRAVAPRLSGAVRTTDIVARVGGDEFVVVLAPIVAAGEPARVAERIVGAFAQPVALERRQLYSSASVGVAMFPADGATAEELLRSADAALARAKRSGPGSFMLAPAPAHARATDRLELERGLRRALERDEFELHYQPIVDRAGRPAAVEALLRWRHPVRGLLGAELFVPLCEESGLIVEIGRWVAQTAIAQAARWLAAGLAPLRLAINVSARQVLDAGLPATIAAALAATGFDARLLEVEITESAVMGDVTRAKAFIAELRALGGRIALDDFGTGYSALSYLKHFTVDALKIDRAFVTDLAHDGDDVAIVTAVVALGHALGLSVVAEGIETIDQAHAARALGCDELQGYHFAAPLPAAAFEALVRAWPRP